MTIADRITQRTSEIKQKFNANKAASESLKQTIQKSLDSSIQNAKDIKQAQKDGKIADDKAQSATFLNNINQVLNESIASADSSTLKSIDKNLEDIKKLIADYTKSSIDKQDTSIKKISKATKQPATSSKSKESESKKDSKYGAWDWLKDLLMLGVGLLPLIWAAKSLFKIGLEIAKFGKSALNGIISGIGWLVANVKNLAKLTGTVITGVVKFFTEPVKWFMSNIWPALKTSISSLISEFLGKIPGAQYAKQIGKAAGDFFKDAGSKIANGAKGAFDWANVKFDAAKKTVFDGLSSLKSKLGAKIFSQFPGLEQKYELFKELGSKSLDKVKVLMRKTLGFIATIKRAAGGDQSLISKYGSKIVNVMKKAAGKAIGRLTAFIAGCVSGPAGWILSALMIGWGVVDMLTFWFKYGDVVGWDNPKLYLFGIIYGLIGIDMWEDKELEHIWENSEELAGSYSQELSGSVTNEIIKKSSAAEREVLVSKLDDEYSDYANKFNSLLSKTITYRGADGNVLSAEDSQKIQNLEIQKADLQAQRAMLQATYAERLSDKNYIDGEVEISKDPKKFKKMIDYFYDDFARRGVFDSIFSGFRGADIEKWRSEVKKANEDGAKFKSLGKTVDAAKAFAKAQIYGDMIAIAKSGVTNLKDIESAIKQKNKFEDHNEALNAITARLNSTSAELSNYGGYSEYSSSSNASNIALMGTSRAMAAANYAESHAKRPDEPRGQCARYVNNAIEFGGGYRNFIRGHGYQVGENLTRIGWELASGTPKIGDVAVFDKDSTTNPEYGHAAILTKSGWVSDFKQNGMSPYKNQAGSLRHAVVYRDTGKSGVTALPKYNSSGTLSGTQDSGQSKSETPQSQIVVANTPTPPSIPESTIDLTEYWELLPA